MKVTVTDMEDQPIRILQRPCTNASESISGESVRVTKTLEQKAAEYAAARDRIMGVDYKRVIPATDGKTPVRLPKETVTASVQQSVVSTNVSTPTPLMSIQASPYNLPNKGVNSTSISQRQSTGLNAQKPANQSNVVRPVTRMQPPSSDRVLSSSASSPSLCMLSRSRQQNVPLFPTQHVAVTNAGLLPTPGFNYATSPIHTNTGLSHSQSAALSLMHQFALFQQQSNQQLVNGLHSSFSPAAIHNPNVSHMGYASVIPPPSGAVKQAHPPPTFN